MIEPEARIQRLKEVREQETQHAKKLTQERENGYKNLHDQESYLNRYREYQEKLRKIEELKLKKQTAIAEYHQMQKITALESQQNEERQKLQEEKNRRFEQNAIVRGKKALEVELAAKKQRDLEAAKLQEYKERVLKAERQA